jgi:SAM-dependent methyltransferase
MLGWLRRSLGNVHLYIALQKSLGTDRVRDWCVKQAELKPADRVLDIGCGPAYYFDRLPPVEYHGFDTSEHYLAYARRRYGDRGAFHSERLTEEVLRAMPRFDAVLLFGLLHHLSDPESADLLHLAAQALAPGGRVISVDPCLHDGQGRVSRWLSVNDRGEFVRTPDAYDGLAGAAFEDVSTDIVDWLMRVPYSQYVMKMRAPRFATTA